MESSFSPVQTAYPLQSSSSERFLQTSKHRRQQNRPLGLPARIISGGQTGVDRAALDVAIQLGIPHGGWCPKGRIAEDGAIPSQYGLSELPSTEYTDRTRRNVFDSDGTLILYKGQLQGGTFLTSRYAEQFQKPCLKIRLSSELTLLSTRAKRISDWISNHQIFVLNVAGPRASKYPSAYEETRSLLLELLSCW